MEIKICNEQVEAIKAAAVEKFRKRCSEESAKIDFRRFVCERVLNNTPEERTIALLGRMRGDPTDSKALAILSKTEFTPELVLGLGRGTQKRKHHLGNQLVSFEEYFHNTIFRKYFLQMQEPVNKVQANFIYPATEMLISKYTRQQSFTVRETPAVYRDVTEAVYLKSLDMGHASWMVEVLEERKEKELCVFENEMFKLQKDYKFNEGDLQTMYLLALPKAPLCALRSIRDLSAAHLPFLRSVQAESLKAIEATFGVPQSKVLAYFHYLPTYWLLHVHFEHIDRKSVDARSSVPLEQVIANLEIAGDYYQKATLVYTV